MAEQIVKTPGATGGSNGGRQQPPKSAKKDPEMVSGETGAGAEPERDLKERIVGLASESADAARAKAEEFAETAKDFAAEAGESLKRRAYEEKQAGADYVAHIADAIRRASREFDNDLPIAGVYMRKAANKVEDISDTVQRGDLSDLVHGVQDFARRQPTVFLGLAVLAGFGAVRFLKSSGRDSRVVDAQVNRSSDDDNAK
ncbi:MULTISPECIES: hypothetical protein [Rhodopseudomonas]|uniref:Nutrient deprivation-induced protein n=1 Tax=Rhodopseudomonas palustris (strain DX-1) TaxID=652103 RepID=E6VM24_RHOPX|nr:MULTISPECIES: hypothetical protein [Rhodopseudomonas]NEW87223.1 hypothetical protein [Rhodopseudomonas sp. WA056]QDL96241.1 hypothetical protein FLL57_02500 [Rhodopseudomonas palustris]